MRIIITGTTGFYCTVLAILLILSAIDHYFLFGPVRTILYVNIIGVQEFSLLQAIIFNIYSYALIYVGYIIVILIDVFVFVSVGTITFWSAFYRNEIIEFNRDLEIERMPLQSIRDRLKKIILIHETYVE